MTTYRLLPRDGSCTFQKIMTGRKWVGRVTQHADGDWIGVIGKEMVRAPTPVAAFEEIAARAMGHPSAAALKAKNAAVRQGTRLVNAAADHVYREVLHGNFKPLDAVHKGRPVGLELALRGFTRDLRRDRRKA